MKIIDLSYYYSKHITDPYLLLKNHHPNIEYVNHLPAGCQCSVIKFLNYNGELQINEVNYYFFKGDTKNFFSIIPAYKKIKEINPDAIIIHGFTHPLQILLLKKYIKNVKLLLQFHADKPYGNLKAYLQKKTDRSIYKYLFTSTRLSDEWIENKIITNKINIAAAGSSSFTKVDKEEARKKTGIKDGPTFLWVGNLNKNKDVATTLKGFKKYCINNKQSRLYIIYQSNELINETKILISKLELTNNVFLINKIPYSEMADWYSSADYYISSSLNENYGFSLVEAMSCGCIPIVTSIPPFLKITNNGEVGYLFNPMDDEGLYHAICNASYQNKNLYPESIIKYFDQHLSFKIMAKQIFEAAF